MQSATICSLRLRRHLAGFLLMAICAAARADTIVSFDEKQYGTGSVTGANGSYFDGGGQSSPWASGGVTFNNYFFGSWYGWAYSNVNNPTDGSWENQYAAWTGTGVGGSGNYAVAFDDGYSDAARVAYLNLPAGYRPTSIMLANTAYAAITMRDGDPYGMVQAFTTGDYFTVTLTGWSELAAGGSPTGTASFQLANGSQIVSGWNSLNLAGLSDSTRSISVSFADSQNELVPAYAAFDNLTITAVPEPSTVVLLACGALAAVAHGRMRNRLRSSRHGGLEEVVG